MLPDVCQSREEPRTNRRPTLLEKLKARFRAEDGNATIESVLWMPFFVALFTLIVDGTVIFNNHSNVLRIVHDANRAFSVGNVESGAETETLIAANAAHISSNLSVTTSVTNGIINTVVRVPAGDMDMTGLFSSIAGATITINAQHYLEL